MHHIRIILASLAVMPVLTSCQQTYTCHCEHIPGTMSISNIRADEQINAPSHNQAENECDEHDNASTDCSIL